MWMFVFILVSLPVFAQVRDVQSGLSFFEKNVITVDLGRSPASSESIEKEEDGSDFSFYSYEPTKAEEFSDLRPGYPFILSHIKSPSGKRPTGFEFTMVGPNELAAAPLARGCDPECITSRHWEFRSKQGSRQETYLVITDDAGSGYLSQQMESTIVLLPRKRRPFIELSGDELLVTLTTGEKVTFDRDTKLIKSGVLKEGMIDSTVSRHDRKFVPLSYSGPGILIRADKRGGDPRIEGEKVTITQRNVTCELKTQDFWNPQTADFKFAHDEDVIQLLNSKCPEKFSL